MNRSIDSAVTLSVALAERSNSKQRFEVSNPSWNIKVTQLECESKMDVFHHNEKSLRDDLLMLGKLKKNIFLGRTCGSQLYYLPKSGNLYRIMEPQIGIAILFIQGKLFIMKSGIKKLSVSHLNFDYHTQKFFMNLCIFQQPRPLNKNNIDKIKVLENISFVVKKL